jgi:cytochrome b involved in lipid metabolism
MKKITSISLFIFFAIVTAVLTAGLVFYQDSKNINTNALNTNINNTDITPGGIMVLDLIEVAKHNTNTNCWIIVNSKVYNISNYASSHPGGTRNILDYCGKEATRAFDTKGGEGQPHSTSANNMLDQFLVGNLNQKLSQSAQNSKADIVTNNTTINNTIPNTSLIDTKLTAAEIAKHNIVSNCWIVVNSKVYNISNYASSHPGGTRNILDYCGKEATVAFDTKGNKGQPHSTSANNMLDQYFVGNLNQDVSQSTINTSTQNAQVNNTNTNKGGDYEDDD